LSFAIRPWSFVAGLRIMSSTKDNNKGQGTKDQGLPAGQLLSDCN
jgi:hypothetical protein